MLKSALDKWGFDTLSARSGNEAWEELEKKEHPQLLILDWEMPGMDGVTICRRIREKKDLYPVYIILLSGKDSQNDIISGLDAGADDYIKKPYNPEELKARVNVGCRFLELYRMVSEQEKLKGVLEMAGAVCHEINQPLQSVMGFSEILLLDTDSSSPEYETLCNIKSGVEKIGTLTRRIMNITKYHKKSYMNGLSSIIDIEKASQDRT